MSDFFDRLDKYMAYSKLNDNQLTVLAHLSVGALGKQRKSRGGMSAESVAKILYSCPNLDAEWLLTGNGDMLKRSKPDEKITSDMTVGLILNRDEQLIRENERLKIHLEELERKSGAKNTPPLEIGIQSVDK